MNAPAAQQSAAPKLPNKTPKPEFPSLAHMPETPEELFRSTALTVSTTFEQPHPDGKQPSQKQDYALPWTGFAGWRDARARLSHFEKNFKGEFAWVPFND